MLSRSSGTGRRWRCGAGRRPGARRTSCSASCMDCPPISARSAADHLVALGGELVLAALADPLDLAVGLLLQLLGDPRGVGAGVVADPWRPPCAPRPRAASKRRCASSSCRVASSLASTCCWIGSWRSRTICCDQRPHVAVEHERRPANATSSTMMVTISSFLPRTAAVRPVAASRSPSRSARKRSTVACCGPSWPIGVPRIRLASSVDRPPMSPRSSRAPAGAAAASCCSPCSRIRATSRSVCGRASRPGSAGPRRAPRRGSPRPPCGPRPARPGSAPRPPAAAGSPPRGPRPALRIIASRSAIARVSGGTMKR